MKPFQIQAATPRANATQNAVTHTSASIAAPQFIAGGTTQIDLMKEDVLRPNILVDLVPILSKTIEARAGGLRIGAGVSNTAAAYHPEIQRRYPGLSEAILAGASAQIRNMASMGGNVLQKTRCSYYRDTAMPCNKREPGSGCSALTGINADHAVLGGSEQCITLYHGDMAVPLAALDAVVQTQGPNGARSIVMSDFHRLPGDTPQDDTVLQPGEYIAFIDLPAFGGRSHYLKIRDRSSYAYARASCAVAMEMDGANMKTVRIALGSVAPKPWRATEAEQMLAGKAPSEALFREAARAAFAGAKPLQYNAYKVPLGQNVMVRCLMETSGLMPMQGAPGTVFASSVGAVAGMTPDE